jgi:hypothetical protein
MVSRHRVVGTVGTLGRRCRLILSYARISKSTRNGFQVFPSVPTESAKMSIKHLDRLALDAHRRGIGWNDFWQEHGAAVCAAEPHSRERFQRLVRRLLSLLTSGDTANVEPLDAAWEHDDAQAEPSPSDTGTQARCLWPLPCGCLSQCAECQCQRLQGQAAGIGQEVTR